MGRLRVARRFGRSKIPGHLASVFCPQGRGHAAQLGLSQRRYTSAYPDLSFRKQHKSGARQQVEIIRVAEGSLVRGGGHQAEKIGHRSRANGGSPEATHIRMVGRKTGSAII